MRRGTLRVALGGYAPLDEPEARSLELLRGLLVASEDPFSRTQESPGHVTASAIVVTAELDAVLLVHHASLGRWLQPGGHIEPGDRDVFAAARREVLEETGLAPASLAWSGGSVFDVDVHEIPARPSRGEGPHRHFDVRVLFEISEVCDVRAGPGVLDARWVPLEEVAGLGTDASVLRCVGKLHALRARLSAEGARRAPAVARNREPILRVLREWVRPGARVLEVGAGTGEHGVWLAPRLEVARWVPADLDPLARASTRAHREPGGVVGVPVEIDASVGEVPEGCGGSVDVVFSANMVHISPRATIEGLARIAATALRPGGRLILYGPFHHGGVASAPSNAAFDADLRERDPRWGVRDLEDVVATVVGRGFAWCASEPMPANNLVVVFERLAGEEREEALQVLQDWFGADATAPSAETRRSWWSHDEARDAELRVRFGALHARAASGALESWTRTPRGTLALVVLLDQVSRQIHRGSAGMFAQDAEARRLGLLALRRGDHEHLTLYERLFLWMPFMHAEDLELQELAVALFLDLAEAGARVGDESFAANVDFARQHEVIVRRFGRFPHRNALLGRASTPEEEAFLLEPGSSF